MGPSVLKLLAHAMNSPDTTILGIGNALYQDEGIGVHVVRRILEREQPDNIVVIDGGTEGLGLLDVFTEAKRLVVIDCVRAGNPPGTVYCFDWDALPTHPHTSMSSQHQVSLSDIMAHAALLGPLPKTTILGVEPESVSMGLSLTPHVAAQVERVCTLALLEAQRT